MALADVYGSTQRPQRTVDLLRPLLNEHPDSVLLLNNLAWNLAETAPREALTFAEKAYVSAPEEESVLDTYAMVLAQNGQYEKALRAADRGIEKSVRPVGFQLRRVEILYRSGEHEQATVEFEALKTAGLPVSMAERADLLERQLRAGR